MSEQTDSSAGKPQGQTQRRKSRLILTLVLIAAALGFGWAVFNEDHDLRVHFLEDARMVSQAIDWRHVQGLSASTTDLESPAYRRIKEQLIGTQRAALNKHFVYLLRQRPDGVVVILADSEPTTSREYSPPGQEYPEATAGIRQVFDSGREATVGPYSDRWGRWVSAIVPVTDPETGSVVALLGMDIDARDWNWQLALETAEFLALILMFVVPLTVYLMQRRRSEESLRLSRDEWQNTFDSMPDLIAILDTEHRIVRANRAMRQKLEQDGGSIVGQHCYRHVHKQDAPPEFCPHARLLKDGASHAEEAHLPELAGDFSVSVTPLHDADGKLSGSIHIAHDVTVRKRAEDALKESNQHYQALYRLIRLMCDNVPDLIWAKDLEQRYIFANRAMCETLLIAEDTEEPIGRTDIYFAERERAAHPGQPDWHTFGELCMDTDTEVMTSRIAGRFDESGNVKGRHLLLDVSKAPFWDEQGVIIGTVGCGRDVTKVRQLEEELRNASDEWRRTFDTIPYMITIVDNDHRIVRANRATWLKLGCEIQDLLGKPCYTMFHGLDAPPVFCPHHQMRQDGLPHSNETFEPRLGCHLDVTVTPLCHRDGKMTGRIQLAHTYPGLKRAGEALLKSESLYRSILNASPDTIAITDLNRVIRMVSPSGMAMFGFRSNDELQGRSIVNFLIHEDRERARSNIRLMFHATHTGPDEYRVLRADGSTIMVEVNGDFILDGDGRPESMIFVVRDISERKRVEEELGRKNAEIEQFIYTVSHDLRSPLVTIKTFLGYLEQDISTGDSVRLDKDMGFMHTAADRMESLLNELLDMSRVGRTNAPRESVSLQEMVAEALDAVAGQITAGRVHMQVCQNELPLHGDRRRLLQIWQNLLDNAIKYMGDQPEPLIEIGVEQQGETVFFVRDNGIGISPEYHSKVFGIFEKLDRNTSGVGMGLTMVRRIIESYGGHIRVESGGEGQGSCFRFTLPEAVTECEG